MLNYCRCLLDNFWITSAGSEDFTGPNTSSPYGSFQQDYSSSGGQQRTATRMLFLSGLNLFWTHFLCIINPKLFACFHFLLLISRHRFCPFLQGVRDFSVPVGLDAKVKVDLVVVGSVAVSEKGNRSTFLPRFHHLNVPILWNTASLNMLPIWPF